VEDKNIAFCQADLHVNMATVPARAGKIFKSIVPFHGTNPMNRPGWKYCIMMSDIFCVHAALNQLLKRRNMQMEWSVVIAPG